jgi:hypothetical protein
MANPQTPAPSTTTTPANADTTPRGDGSDMLARTRAKVSAEQHAAQLAAQARVEEAERSLAATQAQVATLQAEASKAATVEGAQRHELALVDRKHALELSRIQHQWALDDARKTRDRQIAESDRSLGATVEAQRVAEVRRQCDAISQQNVELNAAIAVEESRITVASMIYGAAFGAMGGGAGAMLARQQGNGAKHTPGVSLFGVGGALAVAAPLVAPYFKPTAPQLPTPVNGAGWDAYLLTLTADNAGLHRQLAALKTTTVSLPTMLATAAGVGAVTYSVAS